MINTFAKFRFFLLANKGRQPHHRLNPAMCQYVVHNSQCEIHTSCKSSFPGKISYVKPEMTEKMLKVKWADGFETKFPFIWLLDSARFTEVDPKALTTGKARRQRAISLNELSAYVEPQNLTLSSDGDRISIRWPPYKEAVYESDWLKQHASTNHRLVNGNGVEDVLNRKPVTWTRIDIEDKIPVIDAVDLIQGNLMEIRQKMIQFGRYGILIITGCGSPNLNVMQSLGYGAEYLNSQIIRCTGSSVQALHTGGVDQDFVPPLGVMMIKNQPADPEATIQLADGFVVAEQLQQTHSATFAFLCNTPIEYMVENQGVNGTVYPKKPVFTMSPTGTVESVAFNNALRSSTFTYNPQHAYRFYEALRVFNFYSYMSRNLLNIRIQQDHMILFNNSRVLHGNTAYTPANKDQHWIDEMFLDDEPLRAHLRRLGCFF